MIAKAFRTMCMLSFLACVGCSSAKTPSAYSSCINNLRTIDGAKEIWAEEFKRERAAVPTWNDLAHYIKETPLECPESGNYRIGSIGEVPICSCGASIK